MIFAVIDHRCKGSLLCSTSGTPCGMIKYTSHSIVQLLKSLAASLPRPPISTAHLLHSYILKSGFTSNPFVSTSLITLYSSLDSLSHAFNVFDQIPRKSVISYTAIARAFSLSNRHLDSIRFVLSAFNSGLSLDPVALSIAFSSCRSLPSLHLAMSFHALVFKSGYPVDAHVTTALINVYGDTRELSLSKRVFDESVFHSNVVVCNTIIQQYVKNGELELADKLFVEMPIRDVVTWNTMISCFCKEGGYKDALSLFNEMEFLGIYANTATMGMILSACASLGALDTGIWVHAYIEKKKMNTEGILNHCLIDMYAKCGSIDKAIQVFEKSKARKDLFSWTSIICGLAIHGQAKYALELFSEMQEVGVKPDSVTLVGVLNACAHCGLVDEGYHYFRCMKETFNILPKIEHYGCMVDLLCRVGRLKEACLLIKEMPMKPNVIIWGSLLNGCKVYKDAELGEVVVRKLVELDPSDHWARVMMSNLHAGYSNWSEMNKVRKEMKEIGSRKMPGCSSIEVNGGVHEFVAGGNLHLMDEEIRNVLGMIENEMQDL